MNKWEQYDFWAMRHKESASCYPIESKEHKQHLSERSRLIKLRDKEDFYSGKKKGGE